MLQPLQEQIVQAGLVDLDGSYVVQLAIFLVFGLILNLLVVKPLGRLQELRYARMEGARVDAEKMDLRAAEASASYQRQIDDARGAAVAPPPREPRPAVAGRRAAVACALIPMTRRDVRS